MARNTTVAADLNAPPVTRTLAQFASGHPSRGWSDAVEREAHRTFLNWMGCAIGAARHPTLDAALAAMQELGPSPQATILGRSERVDMATAALLNGISSHTFDYDDTHLKTIIHPAGPVASAALALAEHLDSSGRQLIDALVLGIDVACRVGNTVYPEHYDRGLKFRRYREIESLTDYILVDQDQTRIEQFTRGDANTWTLHDYQRANELLRIASIVISLPLAGIYQGIEFLSE